MERPMKRILIAGAMSVAFLLSSVLSAQEAAPTCDAVAAPWAGVDARVSGTTQTNAADFTIVPGQAAMLRLHPDHEVSYVTLPAGEGEESSFGGMVTVRVTQSGRYMVGMSESAWVDVAQGGAPVEAEIFGPGPACSGIRKGVSFELVAGEVVVELSGNLVTEIGVIFLPN